MEFSTHILTDFALNLAGYIVVALLVYLLLSKRANRAQSGSDSKPAAAQPTVEFKKVGRPVSQASKPEFISLFGVGSPRMPASAPQQPEPQPDARPPAIDNRRDNRRAIYREAKRLLALGGSRTELLATLPLTEDELEMLSVTAKA